MLRCAQHDMILGYLKTSASLYDSKRIAIWFRKYDQQQIISAIETQLVYQANEVMQQRKRMRPNQVAEWELRSGKYRIFYDVRIDETMVSIVAIGYKQGSVLYIRAKEYQL